MKTLEDMSLEELWELFPIILTKPNPQWTDWAIQEISHLQTILSDYITHINHIGSTSIRAIWAKPIIDILLETDRTINFPIIKSRLINVGYICMNETDSRLDFNKGYTPEGFADKVFHIHIRLTGDNDEIYFRDYLISHPEVAKEYEKLKLSLWKSFEHNRDGYTNAKSDFVNHYTNIAKQLSTHSDSTSL
ncbi:MAG: GrpB family protein [Muribaculaceae bacterium]|nr:GrpB family protein [Muribaculaceae bacterium]